MCQYFNSLWVIIRINYIAIFLKLFWISENYFIASSVYVCIKFCKRCKWFLLFNIAASILEIYFHISFRNCLYWLHTKRFIFSEWSSYTFYDFLSRSGSLGSILSLILSNTNLYWYIQSIGIFILTCFYWTYGYFRDLKHWRYISENVDQNISWFYNGFY